RVLVALHVSQPCARSGILRKGAKHAAANPSPPGLSRAISIEEGTRLFGMPGTSPAVTSQTHDGFFAPLNRCNRSKVKGMFPAGNIRRLRAGTGSESTRAGTLG